MDPLFILIFIFMFISSIVKVINEAKKTKEKNDINKKIEEIYNKKLKEANKKTLNKKENIKKIGNLEKHYDEAIRDDYKAQANDYFSDKSRKLDEYLSRDINDRLKEYKENKTIKILDDSENKLKAEDNAFDEFNIDEDKIIFSQTNMAKSIIIKEILDKPLALRRIND